MKKIPKLFSAVLDVMSEQQFFNEMQTFGISKKMHEYKNFKLIEQFSSNFDADDKEFAAILFENQINYIDRMYDDVFTLSKETLLEISKLVIKKLMIFKNIISIQPLTSSVGIVKFDSNRRDHSFHDQKVTYYATIATTFNNFDYYVPIEECQEPLTTDQITDIATKLYNNIACSIIHDINCIADKNSHNIVTPLETINRDFLIQILDQQVRRIKYDTKLDTNKQDYILTSFYGSIIFLLMLEKKEDSLYWFDPIENDYNDRNESLMHTGRIMAITPYDDTPFVLFDVFSTACINNSDTDCSSNKPKTTMIVSNNSDGYIFSPQVLVAPIVKDNNIYFCTNTAKLIRDKTISPNELDLLAFMIKRKFNNSLNYFNKLSLLD